MTHRPEVSVCIPARNGERHLAATLHAVRSQTVVDLDIVVVDNASTDRTAEIVASCDDPRIRLVRNEKLLSLPDNWNRAVAECRAPLIKVVCADDLIHPDLVRRQKSIMDDPAVALVASRRHLIGDDGRVLVRGTGLRGLVGRRSGAEVAARVVRHGGNPIGEPGGVLFRRRDFDAVGGFDGAWYFPMDLHLSMRLLRRGDLVGQSEPLAAFRASAGSLSSRASRSEYEEQVRLTHVIATDRSWGVGRGDRALSRLGVPLARTRRRVVFWASSGTRRRLLAPLAGGSDTDWLEATAAGGAVGVPTAAAPRT